MDLPRCLNKSQSDLEGLQKEDLIDMLMDSNAFILQHLLNENTMLKEQLQVMVASTSAQAASIDELTERINSVETEIWRKDVAARQLTVDQGAVERSRAQSMDSGMMQKIKQQRQQQRQQQQPVLSSQLSMSQGAVDRARAQSMDTGMMQRRQQQQQQQQQFQQQQQQQQQPQMRQPPQRRQLRQRSVIFQGVPEYEEY